jgi:hypothetical protein
MIVFRLITVQILLLVDQLSIIPEITILDFELFEGGKLIFEIFTGHFTLFYWTVIFSTVHLSILADKVKLCYWTKILFNRTFK